MQQLERAPGIPVPVPLSRTPQQLNRLEAYQRPELQIFQEVDGVPQTQNGTTIILRMAIPATSQAEIHGLKLRVKMTLETVVRLLLETTPPILLQRTMDGSLLLSQPLTYLSTTTPDRVGVNCLVVVAQTLGTNLKMQANIEEVQRVKQATRTTTTPPLGTIPIIHI